MQETITTLPTEVIEEFMSYMAYSDIAALARTSKRLYLVAAPRLRGVIPLLTAERMRVCIQSLATNPQKAAEILEIHISKLMRREGRQKPSPRRFTVPDLLIAALERVLPLPFVPVETYLELGRIFRDALRNMTSLRTLVIHLRQRYDVWHGCVIIPSLREMFVHPGAGSWYLWEWTTRQPNLTILQYCWKDIIQSCWWLPGPPYHGPLIFSDLQTLITDPEGAAELLPKCAVSDLTIQSLSEPSSFCVHPIHVANSHWADYKPPSLYETVRSNQRAPLRRITLSGTVDGICSVLKELQCRDSLPPCVRVFFDLENWKSERDLVRQSP
jgi:F-box domain